MTGIFVAAAFLVPPPTGTPEQQLASFDARAWEILGIVDVLILLTALPFAAYLRSVLEGRAPGTASAAAILFIVGAVVGVSPSLVQVLAIGTLSSTYTSASATAADRAAAVLVANVLSQVSKNIFPVVLLEAGILLFSAAMLNSRIFANWVADVGVASAVFAILIVAVMVLVPSITTSSFLGILLFLGYLVLLEVWVFGAAGYLARAARPTPIGAPAPA